MRRWTRHIVRGLNALGVVSALLFVAAGLLGPDLHAIVHLPHVHERPAADCSFDGKGAHFESDWHTHSHGDCTLCSRVGPALSKLDVLEFGAEEPSVHRPGRPDGAPESTRQGGTSRGPPAAG